MDDQTSVPVGQPVTAETDEPLWPWLRALLIFNLVVACAEVVSAIAGLTDLWNQVYTSNIAGQFWLTPSFITSFLVGMGMPVAHLVCSIGCLKRRPLFRTLMLVYCAVYVGLMALNLVQFSGFEIERLVLYALIRFDGLLARAALPLVTFYFLTRPPIRNLFIREIKAFEIIQQP